MKHNLGRNMKRQQCIFAVGLGFTCLSLGLITQNINVQADDCNPAWNGSASSDPTVTFSCDSPTSYEIHPVNYTQTRENPCESPTTETRSCTKSLVFTGVTVDTKNTPEPEDDEDVYHFNYTDSCNPASGEVPFTPNFCCFQTEVPEDDPED